MNWVNYSKYYVLHIIESQKLDVFLITENLLIDSMFKINTVVILLIINAINIFMLKLNYFWQLSLTFCINRAHKKLKKIIILEL